VAQQSPWLSGSIGVVLPAFAAALTGRLEGAKNRGLPALQYNRTLPGVA